MGSTSRRASSPLRVTSGYQSETYIISGLKMECASLTRVTALTTWHCFFDQLGKKQETFWRRQRTLATRARDTAERGSPPLSLILRSPNTTWPNATGRLAVPTPSGPKLRSARNRSLAAPARRRESWTEECLSPTGIGLREMTVGRREGVQLPHPARMCDA